MNKKTFSTIKKLNKTISTFWNVGPEIGHFLNLLVKEKKIKTVLEIGSSNGYSGIWIAEALSKNNGQLYTIESHRKKRFSLATKNFKKAGLEKSITQIQGHAPEAIPKTPKHFDLVFLDATKHEYPQHLETIMPQLKKGSIVIADNIISHKKELAPYIKKISNSKNFKSFLLHSKAGLLISIRT